MAKVIAPFKIVGTLDDLNFYVDETNTNRVRVKGKTGITKKQFKENPIFNRVREHGLKMGRASKIAQNFRMLAIRFNNRAKDGSYAGRGNKLFLEILNEDTTNPNGQNSFEKGMKSQDAITYFIGFEGNKLRPLKKVLKTKWDWNSEKAELQLKNFHPEKQLDWPEKAEAVHLAIAYANWNYKENKYGTEYSNEIIIEKEEKPADVVLKTNIPEGNDIQLVFFLIAFSTIERKGYKELKRSNNTVSIIWSKKE